MAAPENPAPNPYLRRAALYAGMDGLLCRHTRFFGAAAQTNVLLAALLAPAARFALSRDARHFLGDIGGRLEGLNLSIARKIAAGRYRPQDLDHAMVDSEQSAVQSHIDQWRLTNAHRFGLIARELDALMNGRHICSLLGRVHAAAASYIGTLEEVRRRLGHPIAFVRQKDRVSVGCALIGRIRMHSGPVHR
ncbi:MAG TPA: hypothetical protein VHW95_10070 [Steroidobacteraceae bacterium]|jgi:hypothetical protein|nr:hypothetical protein [Steroidobacteraceae bacterium]